MEIREKTGLMAPVGLNSPGLKAPCQALIPLLLSLSAALVLLAGIRADPLTLAQGARTTVSADPLAPHPVLVTTIPLFVPSPLVHAVAAVNPTTGYAYVLAHAQYPYAYPHATLMTINGTEVISSSTSVDYGGALAVNSNLGHVYMPVDRGLAVISGTETVGVIPIGEASAMLAGRAIGVEPNSGSIYVDGYDWGGYCIPEIAWCGGIVWALSNGSVIRLHVGGVVNAIGVNPTTGYAYATCRTGGLWDLRYTVVIRATEEISDVRSFGEAIGINPDNGYVYFAEADQNRVHVLSGTQVLQTLTTGVEPMAIGVNPRTGFAYVANTGSNSVTVISATQVIATLAVGLGPEAIGINPESGYIYVANAGNDTLSVISGTQVIWTLPVGRAPGGVGVNPSAGYVYVVNYDDATISVIREMSLLNRMHLPLVVKYQASPFDRRSRND